MKLVLKIIAGLVALVIVAAIALPMFISADYLKAQLQTQVKNATGRDLTIEGKASLSVFPNIAVHVEDVTLGNPTGFTTPYLVHMDVLETGAALRPLLSKELRITGIRLEGAKLNLEQIASGAKNWEFAAAKTEGAKPAPATEETKKPSPLKSLAIGRVTIKDTNVTMLKPGAKPLAIENINLTVDGTDGSAPLKVDGSVDYQKQPVKFSLGVPEMKALMAGKVAAVKANLDVPSGKIAYDGKAQMVDEAPNAEGKFSFDSDNLPALMGWVTGKPAAGNVPKNVNVATQLGFKGVQAITLKELNFTADSLKGAGMLAIDASGAVPSINGELKLGEVNLDALTGKSAAASGAASASSKPAASTSDGWSTALLDLSALRAVNANVKLSAPKLTAGKIVVSDIVADIAMNGGKLNLGLGNLSLYGGAAKGTVVLDASGNGAGVATNLTLSKIDIDAMMSAMSGASKMKGLANVALNVNGRGTSQRALMGSLGGSGNIKVNDGAIKGINIASFLRDAKKGFILGNSSTESTDFTELTASYTIVQGIVSNDDLAMKSPVLRLGGKGTINLGQRSINYRAVPTVVGTLQGQGGADAKGINIPLIITGPWSAISITPDLASMAMDALKDPAALKENLKGFKDGFKDFNSPKDIGAALLGGKKKEVAPAAPVTMPATTAPADATAPAVAAPTEPTKKKPNAADAIGGLLQGFGK